MTIRTMDFSSNAGMGDYEGVIVAELDSPEWRKIRPDSIPEKEANARFIVRACNNFDEMYEALKYATRELEASGLCFDHPTIVKLNTLLARIEGGE